MTPEAQLRIDLAAAFRWAARLGLHEGIANHFSVATSPQGDRFLLNPVGSHFSRIRASELLLLDAGHSDKDIAALGADPDAAVPDDPPHPPLPLRLRLRPPHLRAWRGR